MMRGINLAPLIEAKATESELVDAVICATDFERLIASANKGDRAAAKELLGLASAYLCSDQFGPMAPDLRRYLCKAFAAMAIDNGKSADVALNLRKSGRPPREHRTKLRIAHLIYKRMAGGESLEVASQWLEEHIFAGLHEYVEFYGFKERPDSKTLEGIYAEMLPELAVLYRP